MIAEIHNSLMADIEAAMSKDQGELSERSLHRLTTCTNFTDASIGSEMSGASIIAAVHADLYTGAPVTSRLRFPLPSKDDALPPLPVPESSGHTLSIEALTPRPRSNASLAVLKSVYYDPNEVACLVNGERRPSAETIDISAIQNSEAWDSLKSAAAEAFSRRSCISFRASHLIPPADHASDTVDGSESDGSVAHSSDTESTHSPPSSVSHSFPPADVPQTPMSTITLDVMESNTSLATAAEDVPQTATDSDAEEWVTVTAPPVADTVTAPPVADMVIRWLAAFGGASPENLADLGVEYDSISGDLAKCEILCILNYLTEVKETCGSNITPLIYENRLDGSFCLMDLTTDVDGTEWILVEDPTRLWESAFAYRFSVIQPWFWWLLRPLVARMPGSSSTYHVAADALGYKSMATCV